MRVVVALACRTGVAVQFWIDGDERALVTALELMGKGGGDRAWQ